MTDGLTAKIAGLPRNQVVVLTALQRADTPLSAYQILDVPTVRDAGITAPLTVYRALDKLISGGLVHRIETLNAFVCCSHDGHRDPPAFMVCAVCRKTVEFHPPRMNEAIDENAADWDFHVDRIQLEISGHCGSCCPSQDDG